MLTVSIPRVEETFGSQGAAHWYRVEACHGSDCGPWSGALEVSDPVAPKGPPCYAAYCRRQPQAVTAPRLTPAESAFAGSSSPGSGSSGSGSSGPGSPGSGAGSSAMSSAAVPSAAVSSAAVSPAIIAVTPVVPLSPPASPGSWQLTVTYHYDAIGDLTEVYGPDRTHPYWALLGVDAAGQVTAATEAGGADTVSRSYDAATGELVKTGVKDGGVWMLHEAYGYDVFGERVSRDDLVTGERESYAYDADGRLLAVETTADGMTKQTFSGVYNGVGDFEAKTGLGGTVQYRYGGAPDRVTGLEVTGTDPGVAAGAVGYDAAGRMTSGAGLVVGYDGRGLTVSVVSRGGSAVFRYTPGGALESEKVDGERVWEMDGGLVRVVVHADGTESWRETVGSSATGVIATVTSRWDGKTVTGGVTYLYRGGLGSVEALAGSSGAGLGTLSYTAFGRLRSEADWTTLAGGASPEREYGTRQGFTGGQDLGSLGVVVLGARVYDPALGRWLSPDPAGASASPYVYAGDDPETLTDPTGAFSWGKLAEIAAIVAVAWVAAYAVASYGAIAEGAAGGFAGGFTGGMISSDGNLEASFRAGLVGAVEGAADGAIGGLGCTGFAGALERGALEGVVNGTLSAAEGGSFRSGFIGAVVGAVGYHEVSGMGLSSSGWDEAGRVAMLSAVGGTVSDLSGGSFENGAVSAAFQVMFNDMMHRGNAIKQRPPKEPNNPALSKICFGTARVLGNSGNLIGRQGGIPGQTEQPNTANVIPQQFGVQNGAQLAPVARDVFGTIFGASGNMHFSGVTDVIGGKSPIPSLNVRAALERLNPGFLILELNAAPDQGVAPVMIGVPSGMSCPDGTMP